jgi:hypothetical protein
MIGEESGVGCVSGVLGINLPLISILSSAFNDIADIITTKTNKYLTNNLLYIF